MPRRIGSPSTLGPVQAQTTSKPTERNAGGGSTRGTWLSNTLRSLMPHRKASGPVDTPGPHNNTATAAQPRAAALPARPGTAGGRDGSPPGEGWGMGFLRRAEGRKVLQPDDLLAQRSRLKPVVTLDAGPTDAAKERIVRHRVVAQGQSGSGPSNRTVLEPAHEFVDTVAKIRGEIATLRADIDAQAIGKGGAEQYPRDSMNEWAGRTYRAVSGSASGAYHLDDAKRKIYTNWRSNAPVQATPKQQLSDARRAFRELKKLDKKRNGLDVVAQHPDKPSPAQFERTHGEERALGNFAYYVLPKKPREQSGGDFARLTVNFDGKDAAKAAGRISKVVKRNPGLVDQAKVMGPARVGTRVDDAVVYMSKPDRAAAAQIDKQLRKDIPAPAAASTAPGMEPLSATSAYAEYAAGALGSHELDRGAVVMAAVERKLAGSSWPLTELVAAELAAAGYDPAQPSRLASSNADETEA
jgi:hypothetical protein